MMMLGASRGLHIISQPGSHTGSQGDLWDPVWWLGGTNNEYCEGNNNKKENRQREKPWNIPHFSHNRFYCSLRQSDSIGSAQKLDNMRN